MSERDGMALDFATEALRSLGMECYEALGYAPQPYDLYGPVRLCISGEPVLEVFHDGPLVCEPCEIVVCGDEDVCTSCGALLRPASVWVELGAARARGLLDAARAEAPGWPGRVLAGLLMEYPFLEGKTFAFALHDAVTDPSRWVYNGATGAGEW